MTDRSVGIILVRSGKSDFLDRCYARIRNFDLSNENVILIEHDIKNKKVNLSRLWNEMTENVKSKYLCFLNPDVLITPGWMTRIIECLESDFNIAVVCPSSNQGNTKMDTVIQVSTPPTDMQLIKLSEYALNIHAGVRGLMRDVDPFGFCYMIRKRVFANYRFDERFNLYGQDSYLNWQLRRDDYRTVQCRSAYVWHYGGLVVGKAHDEKIIDREKEKEYALNLFNELTGNENKL